MDAPLVPLQPLTLMKYGNSKSCLILEQSQMRNLKLKRLSCLIFKEITKSPGILPGPFFYHISDIFSYSSDRYCKIQLFRILSFGYQGSRSEFCRHEKLHQSFEIRYVPVRKKHIDPVADRFCSADRGCTCTCLLVYRSSNEDPRQTVL